MARVADLDGKVLVVGAGPVGLTLACELYRHGVPCRVIDKNQGPSRESRAIAVQARTLEVFAGMGLIDAVLASGRKVHQASLTVDGKRITQLSFDELDSPYPYILILPQYELENILVDHLGCFGGQVEWQKGLATLTQDEQGIRAGLDVQGQKEDILTDWLIGCDGMDSSVRQLLGVACEETSKDGVFLLIDLQMDWALAADEIHQFLCADGLLSAFPLPEPGYWRLIVEFGGEVPADPPLKLVEQLLQKMGIIGRPVGAPLWVSAYRVNRRLVKQFQVGRCFLAGDAAHTYSPVGGQGMNMGIQDAHNLAWKLGLVLHRQAWEWLLKSYHGERQPIAAATLRGTDRVTKVVMLRHPVSKRLRKRAATLLGYFEVVQQRIARRLGELDLIYRKSSIIEEFHNPLLGSCLHLVDKQLPTTFECLEFGAAPRAGERAPDVSIAGTGDWKRLFDVLSGTMHSLLLFSGAAPTTENYQILGDIGRLVSKRYGHSIRVQVIVPFESRPETLSWDGSLILDVEGHLHRRYGVCSGGMYLIRPDGYVGFRSQPLLQDFFAAYLKRTFIAAPEL